MLKIVILLAVKVLIVLISFLFKLQYFSTFDHLRTVALYSLFSLVVQIETTEVQKLNVFVVCYSSIFIIEVANEIRALSLMSDNVHLINEGNSVFRASRSHSVPAVTASVWFIVSVVVYDRLGFILAGV